MWQKKKVRHLSESLTTLKYSPQCSRRKVTIGEVSSCIKSICLDIFKAFNVKLAHQKSISPTAAAFIMALAISKPIVY